jgi:hypothetical protein
MSKIQAIVFSKSKGWGKLKAKHWLKSHNYVPIKKVHDNGTQLRYRLRPPNFKHYFTKKLQNGILLIFGYS